MKKLLLTTLTLFALTGFTFGQAGIPNGGFENWDAQSSYPDPDDWDTPNEDLALLGTVLVSKATASADVHSGNSAARLETKNTNFGAVPGVVGLADLNLLNQSVDPTTAFSDRPTSLTGWYKYSPSGSDTAQVVAYFTKWNSGTVQRDTIGIALFTSTATVSSYMMFDEPIQWFSQDNPDTLIVLGFSSPFFSPVTGSVLFLDDLDFTYSTVDVPEGGTAKINLYPNPIEERLTIEIPQEKAQLVVYDIIGKEVMRANISKGKNLIDFSTLSATTYIYKIMSEKDKTLDVGKLLVK